MRPSKNSIIENGGVIITLGSLLFATFGALYFSGLGIIEEIGVVEYMKSAPSATMRSITIIFFLL